MAHGAPQNNGEDVLMGWYITVMVILILIVSELAAEVQFLKEQLQDINIILSRAVARQQKEEVENE